ncbi:hypothetical protein [Naasia lichenicola]|uniref:Uncharacterized protein n=1 Tax=Naasia lichenicola TaxID=2565933 RepID=A0A4S4FSK9_9MICO|nr:hypothetical protein [Naasia lichenicola]THG32892.1 hypothetical protein E6C64_00495 [Naasia lichenicola]
MGERADGTSSPDGSAAASFRTLQQATAMVGDLFGRQAECVEAAALLTATADELGLVVRPRAVSIAAYVHATGRMVATGERARAFLTDLAGSSGRPMTTNDIAPDNPAMDGSEFQRAGHMVVSVGDPALVLDPTFRQFAFAGLPPVSLVASVADDAPATGYWHLDLAGFSVTYFIEDGNSGWQEVFARILPEWRPLARELAEHLRLGRSAERVGLRQIEIPRRSD